MTPEIDPSGPPRLDQCFALWNGSDNGERRAAVRAAGHQTAFVEAYQLGFGGPRGCAFFFGPRTPREVFNAVFVDGAVEWFEAPPKKRGPIRIPGRENATVTDDGSLRLRERR